MPEQPEQPRDDDAPKYGIPLHELTGKHGYARSRAEGEPDDPDDPIDPGAPVAYVAEPAKQQPNTMTIEGAIVGIGNMASAAAQEGGSSVWIVRTAAAAFLIPFVLYVAGRLVDLF